MSNRPATPKLTPVEGMVLHGEELANRHEDLEEKTGMVPSFSLDPIHLTISEKPSEKPQQASNRGALRVRKTRQNVPDRDADGTPLNRCRKVSEKAFAEVRIASPKSTLYGRRAGATGCYLANERTSCKAGERDRKGERGQ